MMAQAIQGAEVAGGFYHDALLGDGITAFERGRGGSESSADDGSSGPFHRIQVDESAEIELHQASQILNTTNQIDEPPSSIRPPSDIETETEPRVLVDWPDLHNTFLPLSFAEFLAISAVLFGAGGSVPENARIFLSSAGVCSLAGFLLCSCGYVFQNSRRANLAARLMTAGGISAFFSGGERLLERFVKLWNVICVNLFSQESFETSKLLPCDQNDKKPLSNRFPSHIDIGPEEESEFNLSGLAKIFLLISANLCLTASAFGLVAGKTLPENARIFLSSAGVCSLAGFLLCSCGYVFQNSRRAKLAARLMTAGGVVAASFVLVLIIRVCSSL